MTKSSFILLLLINLSAYSATAQQTDSVFIKFTDSVTAFIKEKKDKSSIQWKFFYKNFELKLSDPSYTISSFSIMWDSRRKNLLISKKIKGANVSGELMKDIEPGSVISFEDIILCKDDKFYRIKPFIITTTLNK